MATTHTIDFQCPDSGAPVHAIVTVTPTSFRAGVATGDDWRDLHLDTLAWLDRTNRALKHAHHMAQVKRTLYALGVEMRDLRDLGRIGGLR